MRHAANKTREAANYAISIPLYAISLPLIMGSAFLCFCTTIDESALSKVGIDCGSPL